MGAWGDKTFENDDALDYAADLVEANSVEALASAFQAVVPGKYLEAPGCTTALAAWIHNASLKSDDGLLGAARVAVERISADSELRDLWQDSDEFEAWIKSVRDLETRLGAA